jgi:SNF2 family DNA or RNA helicase
VTKEEVLDLPPRTFTQRYVEMTPEQRKMYKEFKVQFFTELEKMGEVIAAPFAMTRLIRFQQILLGFLMDDGEVVHEFDKNPRLDMLCDMLENDISGQVIIWANYTRAIDHITERLGAEAVRYDGRVKDKERHEAVTKFQDGRAKYFVGNQAAGGVGLTLTAGTTMVYYSNSNRPEDRWQSLDRNHRIGQKQNVTVIDLIGGPIDQSTLDALDKNTKMAKTITRDRLKAMI